MRESDSVLLRTTDPYVTAEYAAAFVQGMQNNPDDRAHLMASACCKHFAANSMEYTNQHGVAWDRHNFSASISAMDLADSYLPPFQSCVQVGKVSGLMCTDLHAFMRANVPSTPASLLHTFCYTVLPSRMCPAKTTV